MSATMRPPENQRRLGPPKRSAIEERRKLKAMMTKRVVKENQKTHNVMTRRSEKSPSMKMRTVITTSIEEENIRMKVAVKRELEVAVKREREKNPMIRKMMTVESGSTRNAHAEKLKIGNEKS